MRSQGARNSAEGSWLGARKLGSEGCVGGPGASPHPLSFRRWGGRERRAHVSPSGSFCLGPLRATSSAASPSGLVPAELWERGYFRCVKSDECWKVPSAALGTHSSYWQLRCARPWKTLNPRGKWQVFKAGSCCSPSQVQGPRGGRSRVQAAPIREGVDATRVGSRGWWQPWGCGPERSGGHGQRQAGAGGEPRPWPRARLRQGPSVSGFENTPGNAVLEPSIYPSLQEEAASVFSLL